MSSFLSSLQSKLLEFGSSFKRHLVTECAIAPPSLPLTDDMPKDFELVQLQMFVRHGARSPCGINPFETKEKWDPLWVRCHDADQRVNDPELRQCYPGQLTVEGELMAIELGKQIRNRYSKHPGFLPDGVDLDIMHFESTEVPRVRLTLRRFVDSLFPAKQLTEDEFARTEDPQRIQVPQYQGCANLYRSFDNAYESMTFIDEDAKVRRIREILRTKNTPDHFSVIFIGDTLSASKFHNVAVPDYFDDEALVAIEGAAWAGFRTMFTYDGTLLKLGLGPLCDRFMGQIHHMVHGTAPDYLHPTNALASTAAVDTFPVNAKNGFNPVTKNPPKVVVYAGHDNTIVPLTAVLGIPLVSWPPFCSHIELELWKAKDIPQKDAKKLHEESLLKLLPASPGLNPEQFTTGYEHMPPTAYRHINQHTQNTHFQDAYWVRIVFNNYTIASMPLAAFQAKIKNFRAGTAKERLQQCGTMDNTVPAYRWK